MDLRCPRCKTQFVLADAQTHPAGIPVKCGECGYVFLAFSQPGRPKPDSDGEETRVDPIHHKPTAPVPENELNAAVDAEKETVMNAVPTAAPPRPLPLMASPPSMAEPTVRFRQMAQQPVPNSSAPPNHQVTALDVPALQQLRVNQTASRAEPRPPSVDPFDIGSRPLALPSLDRHARRKPTVELEFDAEDVPMLPRRGWGGLLVLLAVLGAAGFFGIQWWIGQGEGQAAGSPIESVAAELPQAPQNGEPKPTMSPPEVPAAEPVPAATAASGSGGAAPAPEQPAVAPTVVEPAVPTANATETPASDDELVSKGDGQRERDRPQAALALYRRALDLDASGLDALVGQGLCYLDLESPSRALASFQGALSQVPRYGPALLGAAEAYKSLGQRPQAIAAYELYIEVLPDSTEAAVARRTLAELRSELNEERPK